MQKQPSRDSPQESSKNPKRNPYDPSKNPQQFRPSNVSFLKKKSQKSATQSVFRKPTDFGIRRMKHKTKKQRQTANQITIQLEQNIQFRIKTTKISSADYQLAMSWRIRKNREESGSSWTEKAHQILILNFNSTERGLNYLANVRTDLQQVRLNECGRVRKHPVSEHPEELDEAVESKRGEEHRFNPERFSRSWTTSTTTRRGQRRR